MSEPSGSMVAESSTAPVSGARATASDTRVSADGLSIANHQDLVPPAGNRCRDRAFHPQIETHCTESISDPDPTGLHVSLLESPEVEKARSSRPIEDPVELRRFACGTNRCSDLIDIKGRRVALGVHADFEGGADGADDQTSRMAQAETQGRIVADPRAKPGLSPTRTVKQPTLRRHLWRRRRQHSPQERVRRRVIPAILRQAQAARRGRFVAVKQGEVLRQLRTAQRRRDGTAKMHELGENPWWKLCSAISGSIRACAGPAARQSVGPSRGNGLHTLSSTDRPL